MPAALDVMHSLAHWIDQTPVLTRQIHSMLPCDCNIKVKSLCTTASAGDPCSFFTRESLDSSMSLHLSEDLELRKVHTFESHQVEQASSCTLQKSGWDESDMRHENNCLQHVIIPVILKVSWKC